MALLFHSVGILNTGRNWFLVGLVALLSACHPEGQVDQKPPNADMVFWEIQSWESGGGRSRLTIWSDGRSEVRVVPQEYLRHHPDIIDVRPGWIKETEGAGVYFVRQNVFKREIAKEKLTRSLAAGIYLLEAFQPEYLDGGGTLVGVRVDGRTKETVIPMFLDKHKDSPNHRRYTAVAKILSEFDRHAYEVMR